ncbi:hypothetical protein JD969_19965 [Planctomycetota bacterium]|nr:hypothetical protein JD969_19965 [Planctomycetota bacterium]
MRYNLRSILPLFLLLFVTTLLLTSNLAAQQLIVTMNDGKVYTGEKKGQSSKVLVINIAGQNVKLNAKNIKSIEIAQSPLEIYAEKSAKLEDNDLGSRMGLLYDMYDLKAYSLVKNELNKLLSKYPEHGPAKRLLKVTNTQLEMLGREANKQSENATSSKPQHTSKPTANKAKKPKRLSKMEIELKDLISESDLSLIRLWELPADILVAKPRVKVPRKTIELLIKNYSDNEEIPRGKVSQARLFGYSGYKKLDVIFKVGARDLYRGITVVDDPPAMTYWRKTLNPSYISNYFENHFNDSHVPGLKLFNRRPNLERESYTNFLVLSRLEIDGHPFINRTVPEESLLFQWGLPRKDAKYPAPEVENWKPYFKSPYDKRFKDAAKWAEGLFQSIPDTGYGIKYTPPGLKTSKQKLESSQDSNSNNK